MHEFADTTGYDATSVIPLLHCHASKSCAMQTLLNLAIDPDILIFDEKNQNKLLSFNLFLFSRLKSHIYCAPE